MYGPAGSRDHYPRGTRAEVDDPITPNARTPERAQEYRALFLADDLHGRRFRSSREMRSQYHPYQGIDYSLRSATIGSTLAARRAGTNDANIAVRARSRVAEVSMIGSHGLTPNS